MVHVLKKGGHSACTTIKRSHIAAARDKMASIPAQARSFLDTMRGLFRWAFEAQHVKEDLPSASRTQRKRPARDFQSGLRADIDAYQEHWPLGIKERVWLEVLLYTGLLRGDAVMLGRQHVRDDIATLRTEKSQHTITGSLPILPVLAKTLAAGPTAELAFICGANRKLLTKESFGNVFCEAYNKAGVVGKSAMACARRVRPGRQTTARRYMSLRPSSVGKAAEWPRFTHAPRTANAPRSGL
jgi:hypothetical protein